MKTRIAQFVLMMSSAVIANAADLNLTAATISGGDIVSAKVTESNNPNLPVGTKLTGGKLMDGKITKGVVTGTPIIGKVSGIGLSPVKLSKTNAAEVTLKDPVWMKGPLQEKLPGAVTVKIENMEANNASISDASGSAAKDMTHPQASSASPETQAGPEQNTAPKADSKQTSDGKQQQTSPVSTEAKNMSTVGDYLHFTVQTTGYVPVEEAKDSTINTVSGLTFPADSCFRIDSDSEPGKDSGYVTGKFVTKDSEKHSPFNLVKKYILDDCKSNTAEQKPEANAQKPGAGTQKPEANTQKPGAGTQYPPTYIEYEISKPKLFQYDRYRYGWTYGVLAAPFKYYPTQGAFVGNVSVDGYLGYRIHDRQGSSSVLALGVGPTMVTVKNANGSSNITGASVALAFLTEIKYDFVAGFMVGSDFFSKADAYPYSGKVWLGVNLGMKLD